jgi:hypothetical protein
MTGDGLLKRKIPADGGGGKRIRFANGGIRRLSNALYHLHAGESKCFLRVVRVPRPSALAEALRRAVVGSLVLLNRPEAGIPIPMAAVHSVLVVTTSLWHAVSAVLLLLLSVRYQLPVERAMRDSL